MSARVLQGREVARRILDGVAERAASLRERQVVPGLVFVTVGESAEGLVYLRRLQKQGDSVGVKVSHRALDAEATASGLERALTELSQDGVVDGVIVQLPLPPGLDAGTVAAGIAPRKDVDGVTIQSVGRLYLRLPGHVASTAVAMMELLDSAGIDPSGKRAVVVGRSPIVGRPVAQLLLDRNATVTTAHSRTRDLPSVTREAEILMVAVGRPRMITGAMVREGAVVVDAGINVTDGGIVGDVAFEECAARAGAITPVPGGVGPVTNAVLLRNVVTSAEQRDA